VGIDQGPDTSEDVNAELVEAAVDQFANFAGTHTYSGLAGSRDYLVHIPPGYEGAPLPMVILLHGCNQGVDGLVAVTRFDELADSKKFVTVYPEQSTAANAYKCWNWFLAEDQKRDAGEPAILQGIAAEVMANVAVDPKRVHVAGLSAGGAMAVVLAATWPDFFASVGVVAGCPFNGTPCLNQPSTQSLDALIGYVRDAMGTHARVMPLVTFQGDADTTVPAMNAELLVKQWLGANDLADDGLANGSIPGIAAHKAQSAVPGGYSYLTEVYEDASAAALLEAWMVSGMGHAWPGGTGGLPYADSKGPDATSEIYRFLSEHPMP
jgi:poly(hydroxyalkanoate) depolymerase family esterase